LEALDTGSDGDDGGNLRGLRNLRNLPNLPDLTGRRRRTLTAIAHGHRRGELGSGRNRTSHGLSAYRKRRLPGV
jgi:hypothetical protein